MRIRATKLLLGCAAAALLAGTMWGALPVAADDRVVVVQPGDTLSEIALRVGVPVEQLAEINRLPDPDQIRVGQTLQLEAANPAPPPAAPPTRTVRSGETVSGIALQYGTTVAALVAANHLADPSYVQAGAVLVIPGTAAAASGAPTATTTHEVTAGESLWGIAVRYGTSVSELVRLNGLTDPGLIRAGTTLTVPARAATGTGQAAITTGRMPPEMAAAAQRHAKVGRMIANEASRQGVPVSLALALAWQESGWQPDLVSSAGALGVMQLLPATADWIADGILREALDPHATPDNVRAGVALLGYYLHRYGDRRLALAAYYQGMTAVDRHGIYPASRPYVDAILSLEPLFRG